MEKILVTGGTGFIGSHTCVELINNGYDVCIVDSLINSNEKILFNLGKIIENSKKMNKGQLFFRKGDIRDKKFLVNVFKEFEENNKSFNAVIHFAGLKSVNESIEKPLEYWDNNVHGTINLLAAMQAFNCKKIVFSSSATIYKPTLNKLINENSELGPINPYGTTKMIIENMLQDLTKLKSNNWKIINLRYFNPVGAHISGLLGENPKGTPNNLFPILLKVASGEYKKLSIFGNDWPTHDGTCVRDYIHVMDLADAHISALNLILNSNPVFININIGTGNGTSVLEVVETFKKINNCELKYSFTSRRDGDAPYVVADNSLALSVLNWTPKRNLIDMCSDAWRYSNNFE